MVRAETSVDQVGGSVKRARNVWDDLVLSPEEADDISSRSDYIIILSDYFEGLDPQAIRDRYGLDPSVVADIQAGRSTGCRCPCLSPSWQQ